ncbi:hypothetical protein BC628DRAFT_1323025 [Trametes gibbosa]|nr:hypothetical protein BC628DRAFT_1323025 [Trametes gibbosa]
MDPGINLVQETDSKTVMDSLTRYRVMLEDTGFIGKSNGELTRTILAALRSRKAHTAFVWVKGHDGHPRNEEADRLAGLGAAKPVGDVVDLSIPEPMRLSGAKLSVITQKLAYRAIRSAKEAKLAPRRAASDNITVIAEDLRTACKHDTTEAVIWKSLRKKDVTRETRQFLWKTIHDGFMTGKHWLRPNMSDVLQERATCKKCNELDSMDHILFRCAARGQQEIYNMLQKTWELSGLQWPGANWGTMLGAACMVFRTRNSDARLTGSERLWTILATESVYLVWKLRCERVIQNNGKEYSREEVRNRWYATINQRLTLDRRACVAYLEKRALKPNRVAETWLPILENNRDLPPNWVGDCGVLVGIKRGR